MQSMRISELLPSDLYTEDAVIQIPDWAFRPDHWNVAFLRGLHKLAAGWETKRVWEVGCGTGLNLVVLSNRKSARTVYYSDYNPRCTGLATANLHKAHVDRDRYLPLYGSWDLVTPPEQRAAPQVDVVFACIPQVPSDQNLLVGDNLAHYYDPRAYPESRLHVCGLGLNEALLHRARKVLCARGTVVLNLSGRPGISRLVGMFTSAGFQPAVVHEEVIPQHASTSLASLASLEQHGGHSDFEFFADSAGKARISAHTAEARRVRKLPVYHKIYVISGSMT